MEDVRLTVEQATAIITEAKNDGAFADPMPTDDGERISEALELYKSAVNAAKSGVTAPVVQAIVAIAEGSIAPEKTQEKTPEAVQKQENEQEIDFVVYDETKAEPQPVEKAKPAKSKKPKAEVKSLPIDEFLTKERLPIPADPDWELLPVPGDFTTLSDVEVRRLHSQYHGYFSRATWLLVQEESDLSAAEHMHSIALSRAIKEIGGDKITAAKNEALFDPEVVNWKEKTLEHGSSVKKLKALVAIYDATCNRLSREWTMRSEERNTSGNLYSNR